MQRRAMPGPPGTDPEVSEYLPAWAIEGALETQQHIAIASIQRAFEDVQAGFEKHLTDAERLRDGLLRRNDQLQLTLQQQLAGLQGVVDGLSAQVLRGRAR